MKNRKVTYLLLAVVAVIWGVVIRNIATFSKPQQPAAAIADTRPVIAPEEMDMSLLLDYRDPFLGSTAHGIPPSEEEPPSAVMPRAPVPEPIPFSYKGTISKDKQVYALLDNGGTQETASKGAEVEGFRVTSIAGDSISLQKGKERFTLKLQ